MESTAPTSLVPGFRFHPTDEELVLYYLRRKICGKSFRLDVISDIDIYKVEPWDLPGKSKLQTRDLEWYFFSVLDKKYGNGSRTNRATEKGYWKTTGKDRAVLHRAKAVGMKKTLVYHLGRAPKGERTNWVMHEYRFVDQDMGKAGIDQDAFVLCRVFQKSGSGPKNGEKYGAPFVEEEWVDDELDVLPKEEAAENDFYLDENDLEQILGVDPLPDNVPLPLEYCSGVGAVSAGGGTESADDSQKLMIGIEDYPFEEQPNDGLQRVFVGSEAYGYGPEQQEDKTIDSKPVEQSVYSKPVKQEYIGETSRSVIPEGTDQMLKEQFIDASDNFDLDHGSFFESNDLLNPLDFDTSAFGMLEEYLAFSDASGDMSDYITTSNPLRVDRNEDHFSGEVSLSQGVEEEEEDQPVVSAEQPMGHDDNPSSELMATKYETDLKYPFIKQASQMLLDSIPAPPAFASEFPSKDVAHRLNAASSSSLHVTAGMIQIRNPSQAGQAREVLPVKDGLYNITFSFGVSRCDDNSTILESVVRILPGKAVTGLFSGSFYSMLFWVLVLSVSLKMGCLIFSQ